VIELLGVEFVDEVVPQLHELGVGPGQTDEVDHLDHQALPVQIELHGITETCLPKGTHDGLSALEGADPVDELIACLDGQGDWPSDGFDERHQLESMKP
jgi:hypothetical protein